MKKRKSTKGLISIGLACTIGVSSIICLNVLTKSDVVEAAATDVYSVKTYGQYDYGRAQECLTYVNNLRKELGKSPLKMDSKLSEAAMQRAAEISADFSHTRPDGSSWYSINTKVDGENIAAGNSTAKATFNQWKESPGHYSNMISSAYKSVGIGCYGNYWVQLFSWSNAESVSTRKDSVSVSPTIKIREGNYPIQFNLNMLTKQKILIFSNDTFQLEPGRVNPGWDWRYCPFERSSFNFKSSNTNVAKISSNGNITAVKPGLTNITAVTKDGKGKTQIKVRVLFDDVKQGHSFYTPIYWAVDKKVTVGVAGTNKFAPGSDVTRGQVVAFLYRLSGNPSTKGYVNRFSDVSSDSTFYNPILWGGKTNVVEGYDDGTFKEDKTCTRGQIVAFLWRMAGKPEPKAIKSTFKDVSSQNTFYKAILWASEKGITVGYNDGTFKTNGECTRGQMVAFLQRFVKKYPKKVKI